MIVDDITIQKGDPWDPPVYRVDGTLLNSTIMSAIDGNGPSIARIGVLKVDINEYTVRREPVTEYEDVPKLYQCDLSWCLRVWIG
jgi:hypothetical protein